jgi:hypothetical protein
MISYLLTSVSLTRRVTTGSTTCELRSTSRSRSAGASRSASWRSVRAPCCSRASTTDTPSVPAERFDGGGVLGGEDALLLQESKEGLLAAGQGRHLLCFPLHCRPAVTEP